MKIAIMSTHKDLDSPVEMDFGKSYYLLIVDMDSMEFEAFHSSDIDVVSGVGVRTAQLIANKGAEAFLTYYCGPFSFETLSMIGVKVVTGVKGTVREAIENFKQGKLKYAKGPNIDVRFMREEKGK
jgi:predicted Fe-Mo cluster-binding NifX family protein